MLTLGICPDKKKWKMKKVRIILIENSLIGLINHAFMGMINVQLLIFKPLNFLTALLKPVCIYRKLTL